LRIDFEFYLELTRAARNRVFQLLINTIRAAVQSHAPFFAQVSPLAPVVRGHHREVLNAIKAHQPDKAAKAVNDYLYKAQEMLGQLFPGRIRGSVGHKEGQ
jgi:DNA-binding FadR family transcriptional regulator